MNAHRKLSVSRWLTAAVALCALLAGPTTVDAQNPTQGSSVQKVRTKAWPDDLVERFRHMPLQDDGRIKPFMTHVSYLLLRLNGRRTLAVPDSTEFGPLAGTTLSPTEWAMDALFFPALADQYPIFQVQTSEVIDAIGIDHEDKRKRDRYSFNELRPGLSKLMELARSYGHIDAKKRSGLQEQVVNLANNISEYDRLVRSMDAARHKYPVAAMESVQRLVGERQVLRFSETIDRWATLVVAYNALKQQDTQDTGASEEVKRRRQGEIESLEKLIETTLRVAAGNEYLHLFPPAELETKEWYSVAEWTEAMAKGGHGDTTGPELKPLLATQRLHEGLVEAAAMQDFQRFENTFKTLDTHVGALMAKRGEGQKLAMEVDYLQASYFWTALYVFGFGFLLTALTWLAPRNRLLSIPAWIVNLLGSGIVVYGIVVRCILRDRPPISGLYETILFIAASCVITALVIEVFHRRKVFLSLAAVLGFFGMFFANSFENMDGRDTMPTLVAVLDTNFWLATHVTIINLGYAGALLAGFIAHIFLLGQLFGFRHKHPAMFRYIGRATYGTLCFAALFATVGTILGGIWANDSWGRFWGWDPKENGALMIVLWGLMTLHMRLGGFIKDHGFAMLCVAGNIVVVFSWFHTNQLGVGLHSYGFNSGLATLIWNFYYVQTAILVAGAIGAAVHRSFERAAQIANAEVGGDTDLDAGLEDKAGDPA